MASSAVVLWIRAWINGTPPPNVWFGVSVENQRRANERVGTLLHIPAAVRWLSLEPLLGPVDLPKSVVPKESCPRCGARDPLCPYCLGTGGVPAFHNGCIHWLVVGGESGPGARPCNTGWIYDIVRDASWSEVPVFVKQLGSFPVGSSISEAGELYACDIRLRDKKGGDPAEWPEDLRVRQMPKGR